MNAAQEFTAPPCAHNGVWIEYDAAADWCARRSIAGRIGDSLPMNVSAECLSLINDDPEAFAERVRETAYANAQER